MRSSRGADDVKRRVVGAALLTVVASLWPSVSEGAVGSGSVLDLQLNEGAGATTAADASGMNHQGAIGSHVVMNGSYADWDRHPPGEGIPYGAEHLIMVPDAPDGSLDPGSSDFSVEIRLRTKEKFGNVIQKGQSHTVGGQVKFQAPKGKISCMFKSPQGRATATSGATLINDNVWHVVRCDRTQTSVTMYVDGVMTQRIRNFSGTIDNKKAWTIGGKLECDQVDITCDYFPGELDYVRISKG